MKITDKEIRNTKTGNIANVIDYWTSTKTGKPMVTVWTAYGKSHWKVSNTEEV